MRNQKTEVIQNLQTHILSSRPQTEKAFIMLHGFGANYNDLMPLAEMISNDPNITWYFPNGFLEVIIGPGLKGRAWFQIDMARIEQAMMRGEHFDISDLKPPGLDQAQDKMLKFYNDVCTRHSKVMIGGFSQGAMLSTEVTLTADKKPTHLTLLSGALIDSARWSQLAPSCKGVRFIQSHGKNDVILSYEGAEKLFHLLTESGWNGRFIPFQGGHEIPIKVISEVAAFIR